MDFRIKQVEDERELKSLKEFLLAQPQYYPRFNDWVDGKCVPRIESGQYMNMVVLSDGVIVGDAVYRHISDENIAIKNFRIDKDYRRRDLGQFLLSQIIHETNGKSIITDISARNFPAVEFFVRRGFDIVGQSQLYVQGQDEYLLRRNNN